MNTYRITVAYDGTAYRGWQRQENTELTVQGILERRISEIVGKKMVVSGSGRTDSGVHALGQECSLYLEQEIDMDSFKKQLNALLPEDIRVLDISREKRDFHARKSAVGKCYEYQIDLRDKMEVFHRKYRFHFPHPVDIAAMEKAAEYLMGTHDFSAFTDLKEDKDTVRTIYAVGIVYEKDTLTLSWIGDGFLYHMVRILTGTLLDVGIGKIKAEEIPEILIESFKAIVPICAINVASVVLAFIINYEGLDSVIYNLIANVTTNKYVFLLLINVFLLVVGMVLDPSASMVVLIPILAPVARAFGIDLIHFGIIFCLNMMIGLLTPPVGMSLYLLSSTNNKPFKEIRRAVAPWLIPLFIALLVVTYWEGFVLLVPRLFGY